MGLIKKPIVEISVRATPFRRFTVKRSRINRAIRCMFAGLAYGINSTHCKTIRVHKTIRFQIHTRVHKSPHGSSV